MSNSTGSCPSPCCADPSGEELTAGTGIAPLPSAPFPHWPIQHCCRQEGLKPGLYSADRSCACWWGGGGAWMDTALWAVSLDGWSRVSAGSQAWPGLTGHECLSLPSVPAQEVLISLLGTPSTTLSTPPWRQTQSWTDNLLSLTPRVELFLFQISSCTLYPPGDPLQCSCLESSMDKGAWQATVHGVAES